MIFSVSWTYRACECIKSLHVQSNTMTYLSPFSVFWILVGSPWPLLWNSEIWTLIWTYYIRNTVCILILVNDNYQEECNVNDNSQEDLSDKQYNVLVSCIFSSSSETSSLLTRWCLNCWSTASTIGIIMVVVHVLLIHMDSIKPVHINPNNNLKSYMIITEANNK